MVFENCCNMGILDVFLYLGFATACLPYFILRNIYTVKADSYVEGLFSMGEKGFYLMNK